MGTFNVYADIRICDEHPFEDVAKSVQVVYFEKSKSGIPTKTTKTMTYRMPLPLQCGIKAHNTPANTPSKGNGINREIYRALKVCLDDENVEAVS